MHGARGKGVIFRLGGLLLGMLLFMAPAYAAQAKQPAELTVFCMGDDLTDAEWKTDTGAAMYPYLPPVEEHWTTLLAQGLPARVVNVAVAGECTDEMLARFPEVVVEQHPNVCLIWGGMNDILQGRPVQDTVRHIRRMVELCKQNGIQPILINLPLPASPDPVKKQGQQRDFSLLYAAHKQLAIDEHILFVDLQQTRLKGHNGLPAMYTLPDRLHLNGIGQAVVAQKLLEDLQNMDIVSDDARKNRSVSEWKAEIEQYRKQDKKKSALRSANKALEAYPKSAVLYAERANVYLDLSDQKAHADIQKALSLQPDCVEAYLALAVEDAGLGWMKRAREDLAQAGAIEPGNADVYRTKAYYYDLGIADFRSAMADCDTAVERATADRAKEMELDRCRLDEKVFYYTRIYLDRFVQHLCRVLDRPDLSKEERIDLLNQRSRYYREQERYTEALSDNQESIRLLAGDKKGLGEAYLSWARILDKMGEENLAAAAYRQAKQLDKEAYIPWRYQRIIGGGEK